LNADNAQQQIIFFDISFADLKSFVDLIYEGFIDVPAERVTSFQSAASKLKLRTKFEVSFQIFVKSPSGRTLTLIVRPSHLMKEIKQKLAERLDMSADLMRLMNSSQPCDDDKTVAQCNIHRESTLYILMRLLSCNKCPGHAGQKRKHDDVSD